MLYEIEVAKVEFHNLQLDKDALVLSISNIEKVSKAILAYFQRLQQRYRVLEAERDNLKLLIEELNKEKGKLEDKVTDLEDQKNSLKVSLKTAMENKVDVEHLKKHALILRNNIHQM